MEEFKNNIDSLANTSGLENVLIAIIYWLAVITVLLFIGYVACKINNVIQQKKYGRKVDIDDFL